MLKKFYQTFIILFACEVPTIAHADLASVGWLHKYILEKTGITLPEATFPNRTNTITNQTYLYKVIDAINQSSTGSTTTTYVSQATRDLTTPAAVASAVNHLFNCNAAGYWKDITTGSGNHLDGGGPDDASGDGGSITCTICPKDSYCPLDTESPISCETVGVGYVTNGTGATQATDCYALIYPVFAITNGTNGVYRMNNPDTDTSWTAEQMPANAASFGTTTVHATTSGNGIAVLTSGANVFGYNRYQDRWNKIATLSFSPTHLAYSGGIFLFRAGQSVAAAPISYNQDKDIVVGDIRTGTLPINPYSIIGSGYNSTPVNRFWVTSLSGTTYSSDDGITWVSRGTVASSGGHVNTVRSGRDGTSAMSACSANGTDKQISYWDGSKWTDITMSTGAHKTSVVHDAANDRWIILGMGYGTTTMFVAPAPISAASRWTTMYTGVTPSPNGYVSDIILLRNGRIWASGVNNQPLIRQNSSGTFQSISSPGGNAGGAALLSVDENSVSHR